MKIFGCSFVSQLVLVRDSLVLKIFVIFFAGFFPALLVKTGLQFYYCRYRPELFLTKKTTLIQLIRSMRLEGVSKPKICRIFERIRINVSDYLKTF